jgi:acyl-coenzyme A synthetase/AMP-(fatty) acid ligase/acyl carrier protein
MSLFITGSPMRAPYSMGPTVPVGRALDNTRLHVLDEQLRPLPAGEVGDLYVAGARLARGYYGRPGITAERFVANPFARAGQRLYRTGDQVRMRPDGLIEFVGRAGDQVKIRGYRVELAEVESVLARYPGLAHAVVVAREAENGEKRLIAYVVPEAGQAGPAQINTDGLRAHVTELLPEYMVPSAFVTLDSLPLTPNGKVDRQALPEPAVAGSSPYRAPETARQELLCSLFAEVLGVPRVGIDDSFFDLHGESLDAMRLIGSIQDCLGVELLISDVFDAPTVAELDQQLSRALQSQA